MSMDGNAMWIAAALLAVVLIASVRQLRQPRTRRARRVAILLLQVLSAGLLYAVLVPPSRPLPATGLRVLAADATDAGELPASATPPLLLPEADDVPGGQRVPDLATALRQYPASSLTLVGAGLPARDRDTALPPDVRWQPGPAPRGWIDLDVPAATARGGRFEVRAQARGVTNAQAELLDPAEAVVDRAALAVDGRVQLSGVARAEGRSLFQLRLLDADGHVVDTLPVPQQTIAAAPLQLRIRAGAPGAELKYLRRWAADSGIDVQVQSDAGAGVSLGDGNVAIDAASLARTDLLLLDERSLASLGAGQFAAVREALHAGLGVLVRSTGLPSASARQRLRELGLTLQGDGSSQNVQLPGDGESVMLQARRGPLAAATLPTTDGAEADRAAHGATLPALESLALRPAGTQALLRDRGGNGIGRWRDAGKGRVGLLPITDSWRLVLAGRADRHGELWSGVVSLLARSQALNDPLWSPQPRAWAGERQLLCGVQAPLQALATDDTATPLLVDPASGDARCAAWWPREPGWQRLRLGERELWRHVFDPASANALHRQDMIDATTQKLAASPTPGSHATQQVPGSRWPWWLGFVLCASLLWWLERRSPTHP